MKLSAHSANVLSYKVNKAPLGANREATATSLKARALPHKSKFASTSRTKAIASLREVNYLGEAILASPTMKKLASKAKPRAFQPKKSNIQLL